MPAAKQQGFYFPLARFNLPGPARWTLDQGVDIPAAAHTPLYAVGSGIIVRHGITGFGPWAPVLRLDSGEYVYYGHAGPGHLAPVGTRVNAGDLIGEVGAGRVGRSTGPHLEIGFADQHGNPIGPHTAGRMLDLLKHPGENRGPLLGQGAVAAQDTADTVGAAASVPGKILALLTSPQTWLRVVEIIGGVALLLLGLKSFTGGTVDPVGAARRMVPVL